MHVLMLVAGPVAGDARVLREASSLARAGLRFAVRATADEVWRALVATSVTPQYDVGFAAEYDLTPDAARQAAVRALALTDDPAVAAHLRERYGVP